MLIRGDRWEWLSPTDKRSWPQHSSRDGVCMCMCVRQNHYSPPPTHTYAHTQDPYMLMKWEGCTSVKHDAPTSAPPDRITLLMRPSPKYRMRQDVCIYCGESEVIYHRKVSHCAASCISPALWHWSIRYMLGQWALSSCKSSRWDTCWDTQRWALLLLRTFQQEQYNPYKWAWIT